MRYRAGMFVYALAFLFGVVYVQQLSVLPNLVTVSVAFCGLLMLYLALICRLKSSSFKIYFTLILLFILLILIGMFISSNVAKQQLVNRLADDLVGKSILINGFIVEIPKTSNHIQRFQFSVESHRILGDVSNSDAEKRFPKKVRLSWYYGQPVRLGEAWQFEVRLKPPHGFMNPGGFDYESWLFQQGIQATGYVRKSSLNLKQGVRNQNLLSSVNAYRQVLSQQIDSNIQKPVLGSDSDDELPNSLSLVKALVIGDKSSITNQQWRVLTNTGTSHLMAISGLHVGLSAFFAYVCVRRLVPVFIMKHVPAQHIAIVGGVLSAALYAVIAGLSVPTQRALIMLVVLSVMMLFRRNHRPLDSLGFALLLVLLINPLTVLSVGFWFSFSAVAVIFISVNSYAVDKQSTGQLALSNEAGFVQRYYRIGFAIIKKWVRLQLLINIFLLPLSLFMFQQVSLVSPIANLILIPYVSFLVVPAVLLGLVFAPISSFISNFMFNAAAGLLDLIWPFLNYLSELPFSVWVKGDVGIVSVMLSCALFLIIYFSENISIAILRYHQTYRQRVLQVVLVAMSLLLIRPLFIGNKPALNLKEFKVTVLDVGQGSSAVIQTKTHVAVFDAGAKFSDKLDAGTSVVIPYLQSQGIEALDHLIISHGDADHIGGAKAILAKFPETKVIGRDIEGLLVNNKQLCTQGQSWQWDGVNFEILSPTERTLSASSKRNNHSCVLRVSSEQGSVLFTGDIEKEAEVILLDKHAEILRSDILLVPHHGSKTSSTREFLAAVNSKISVISVGYKNKYHHPNRLVVQRHESLNSKVLKTYKSGAITIKLSGQDSFTVSRYRESARKYWHHVVY